MTDFANSKENEMRRVSLRRQERSKYNYKYFAEEYWKEDLPGVSGNRGLSYDDPDHRQRFHFVAFILVEYFKPCAFLDAGCGLGILSDIMLEHCDLSVGVDASVCAFTARSRTGSLSTVAGVEALPFEEQRFDLVFCSDVLEHVPFFDAARALSELLRVTSRWLILTINLDNPYYYHPTLLSRASWEYMLESNSGLSHCVKLERDFEEQLQNRYPEYDVFIYKKIPGS